MLEALLRSRKFWLAVIGVVQTVLFQFVPDFPKEVWQSINILLGVLIAAIAIEDAAEKSAPTTVIPSMTISSTTGGANENKEQG